MADHRSLHTAERLRRITNPSRSIDWKAYGRLWFKSGLDKPATKPTAPSLQQVSAPDVFDTTMSATKELPHPASPSPLIEFPTSSEYAEKVFGRFHHHTISDSTAASNDSSPTTTCSTVDDSSATETSPGSSPESPPPNSFATGMFRPRTAHEQSAPFFELQKAAPPKKGRNLKNLAVNTARAPGRASSTTSLPLAQNTEAEPSIMSPSFVKPPSPPKRKPSNLGLTIRTPASINAPPQQIKLAIPATPSFGRPGTLRHFQSSPSLPLYPTLGDEDPIAPKIFQSTTLETIFSPTEGPQVQAKVDEEQNFDIPLSREEKPEAYPDGPICVHEPYIDLYLEPTAQQARKYDVVMNVAVEVRNPFNKSVEPKSPEPEVRLDGGGGIQYAPKRDRSAHTIERQPSSPTTPKATPLNTDLSPLEAAGKEPEYIHIPWEHNSDIVPDLLRLVKVIDEKVAENKRVLVHCQCGVSRSASLVVAYWLYKDPSLSVQEAYDSVKAKSKWIGPNMNFIMQLQEFRSSLARGGLLPDNRGLSPITPGSALSEWPGPFSSRSIESGPQSAAMSLGASNMHRPVPDDDSLPALSPGPSSAPSGMPWPKDNTEPSPRPRTLSSTTSPTYVDPAGHIIPSLNVTEPERPEFKTKTITVPTFPYKDDEAATPTEGIVSPRATEFAMTPLNPSKEVDSSDAFGLMSPTTTEFTSSPFDRSALLAQLGMGSMHQQDQGMARTQSLGSRQTLNSHEHKSQTLHTPARKTLRGKVSSPSIREQKELQRLQADLEAKLHIEQQQQRQHQPANASEPSFASFEDALMSPRATEFTDNPFAMSISPPPGPASPEEAHKTTVGLDPRSPAHKGVSPITRNIGDVL
ncbi:hypothetical protein Q7P37_004677 [Cladosporium fusiforme]